MHLNYYPILAIGLCLASQTAKSKNAHRFNAALGHGAGGVGFALEYERRWDRGANWGAYIHSYAPSDEAVGSSAAGIFLRPYLKRRSYRYNLTAGIGGQTIALPDSSLTSLGLLFGVSFEKRWNAKLSFSAGSFHYYSWFDQPSGLIESSFLLGASYQLPTQFDKNQE